MNLDKRMLQLLKKIRNMPEKDEKDILELLKNSEWGVAFEILCSVIEQDKITISQELFIEIDEIGTYMELDNSFWADIVRGNKS